MTTTTDTLTMTMTEATALRAGDVIAATPAGRKADGSPITRRVRYTLARAVDVAETDWSRPGTVRIMVSVWDRELRRFDAHPAVVRDLVRA